MLRSSRKHRETRPLRAGVGILVFGERILPLSTALCSLHTSDHPANPMSVTVILAASQTSASAGCSRKSLGLMAGLREEQLQPYLKCVQLAEATQEREPTGQVLPLCGGHGVSFPSVGINCWILCSEARTYLEQLSQNPLKTKGQDSRMGSFVGLYKTAPTIPCLHP